MGMITRYALRQSRYNAKRKKQAAKKAGPVIRISITITK